MNLGPNVYRFSVIYNSYITKKNTTSVSYCSNLNSTRYQCAKYKLLVLEIYSYKGTYRSYFQRCKLLGFLEFAFFANETILTLLKI